MSMLAWFALLAPIAAVVYVLFVRPVLAALPVFKVLYAEADGFWSKAWVLCGRSVTVAVSYVVQVVGWALQAIDPVAELLGDPELKQQIADALQTNPTLLGRIMSLISIVIVAARLRSLFKGA